MSTTNGFGFGLELKDPAIKLFGKTIPLSDSQISPVSIHISDPLLNLCGEIETPEAEETHVEDSGTLDKPYAVDDDESETHNNNTNDEKVVKKPDKVLPCPRCNSYETKFCYFNNYNVNQPRYFCKKCHRYWTAGGTMRNVPVGAGRRKNKHLAPQYHNQMPSCGESSSSSVFKFANETPRNRDPNICGEAEDPSSCVSSSGSVETAAQTEVAPPPPMHCYHPVPPPTPWMFPWNHHPVAAPRCSSELVQWPILAVPVPLQFVPASYWAGMPVWAPGYNGYPSENISPTLGKHSRQGDESCVLVPKTLRIDDPDEASRSSIWATLGITPESKRGIFKAFDLYHHQQDHNDRDHHQSDAAQQALQANPAALSRSYTFQEGA